MPVQATWFAYKLISSEGKEKKKEEEKEKEKQEGEQDEEVNKHNILSHERETLTIATSLQHVAFGAALGLGGGFLGIAGLPFVVSWLSVSSDLTHYECIGTSFLSCVPSVLAGSAAHLARRNVPLAMLAPRK